MRSLISQIECITYLTSSFYDNASIGRETRKGHHDVIVEDANLLNRSFILQFCHSLFLHAKNDNILASNANSRRTFFYRFLSILNLNMKS